MISNLKAKIELLQKEQSVLEEKLNRVNEEKSKQEKGGNGPGEKLRNEVDGAAETQNLHDKSVDSHEINTKLQHMIRRYESELSEKSLCI
jgi:hypothetical protein